MAKLKPCFHHIYMHYYKIYTVHNRIFLLQGIIRALLGTLRWCSLSWGCCLRRNTQFQNNTKNTALWAIAFKTYKYCNHFWGWRGGNSTSYDCDDHDQTAVTAVNAANGCLLYCLLVEGHQHLFWWWNKMPTATYSNQASSSNSQFRKSRYLQREELVHQALQERCAKCLSRTPQAGLRLSQKNEGNQTTFSTGEQKKNQRKPEQRE